MSVESTIYEFATRQGNGVFPNIPRGQVADGLWERIRNPDTINQQTSSLCGPASFSFSVLNRKPQVYVDYVTQLYDKGEARYGGVTVKPGYDCRNARVDGKIPAVDWVALGSLRDSENTFWDYQDASDEFAGITLPNHLESWMNKSGFGGVRNETNLWFTKDIDNLAEAADLLGKGFAVCLFIYDGLMNGKRGHWYTIPTHWIVMTRPPVFKSSKIVSMGVWTWAQRWNVNSSYDAWESGYFGYVAGKLPVA
jgi:hypothetical protein